MTTGRVRAGGFSLVEVILVAVVLGMLLAASVPAFQQTFERLRAEQATFELIQWLRVARQRAVVEGRDMAWTWDEAARRIRVEPVPADAPPEPPPEQTTPADLRFRQSRPIPSEMTVALTASGHPIDCRCIRFFPNGTSDPAVITLQASHHSYTIAIDDAIGQPRLSTGHPAH